MANKMAYWKYLKYVLRHKYYVGIECFKRGLYFAGIFHDMSKFFPLEFHCYAVFFYGEGQQSQVGDIIKSGGNQKLKDNMEKAWLHHVHQNKHHWNYWVIMDKRDEMQVFDMPERYILEMICDWEGASKAIRGKKARAIDWYERQKKTLILSEYTRMRIERLL